MKYLLLFYKKIETLMIYLFHNKKSITVAILAQACLQDIRSRRQLDFGENELFGRWQCSGAFPRHQQLERFEVAKTEPVGSWQCRGDAPRHQQLDRFGVANVRDFRELQPQYQGEQRLDTCEEGEEGERDRASRKEDRKELHGRPG
jgi:hypothetical protein